MTSGSFNETDATAARHLIKLALYEDLQEAGDLTCRALIPPDQQASVQVVSRSSGVLAGAPVAALVFAQLDASVHWQSQLSDGAELVPGSVIAVVSGPLRSLLTGERTALNFLTHLSGIASLTRTYVAAVAGTHAKVLDTRKTHPGYRLLEKYAVRCGGGTNHRLGLYDGVMIKDNHVAGWKTEHPNTSLADAVHQVRKTLDDIPIEVEVDTLDQLREVLPAHPEIVLLDNMVPDQLREAVSLRDQLSADTQLEASGGITLEMMPHIAATGVERISIGALTHSAIAHDIGFDWPDVG